MKKIIIIALYSVISVCLFAQEKTAIFDNRDSNGMGLILYANGLFECDFRYSFLETGVDPILFYSKGVWQAIDSSLFELTSFEEYKPKIENVISYYDPKIGDSVKISVYNKSGSWIGFACYKSNNEVYASGCAMLSNYQKYDNTPQSFIKKNDEIILPYDLTYAFNIFHNQYYFIISAYPGEGMVSYHHCIIEILSDNDFRVVRNMERIIHRGEKEKEEGGE